MNEILTIVISSLSTGGIGGFFGWLFGRKKYNEEVKSSQVQNFDSSLDAYKKMYESMIEDLQKRIENLSNENTELKKELAENRKQIMTLTNFVLASTIKRADGTLNENDIKELRSMM